MLGPYLKDVPENVNLPLDAIDATRFVRSPNARRALGIQHAQFVDNPVAFLRKLAELRRKGQGFLPAHLGQALHTHEIADEEFLVSVNPYTCPPHFLLADEHLTSLSLEKVQVISTRTSILFFS